MLNAWLALQTNTERLQPLSVIEETFCSAIQNELALVSAAVGQTIDSSPCVTTQNLGLLPIGKFTLSDGLQATMRISMEREQALLDTDQTLR